MRKVFILIILFFLVTPLLFAEPSKEDTSPFMGGDRNPYILGFFYGAIFFFVLYNIILYISLREKTYLFHGIFVFSCFCLLFFKEGILYKILGFHFPQEIHLLVDQFIESNTFLWGTIFFKRVLKTKLLSRTFDRMLTMAVILDISFGIFYLIFAPLFKIYEIADIASPLSGLIHSVLMIGGLICFFKKRSRIISVLFISWLAMICGIWIQVFRAYGWLPWDIFIFEYAIYLGILFLPFMGSLSISIQMKVLREERDAHMTKLMQADKMISLGTIASSMAHEIANPNSAISSNIDFMNKFFPYIKEQLQSSADQPRIGGIPLTTALVKMSQGIKGIEISSRQIERFISEVRNYSKTSDIEEKSFVDVNMIIRSSLALINHRIQSFGIQLKLDLMKKTTAVFGVPQHFEQIFVNTLINGAQAIGRRFGNNKTLRESGIVIQPTLEVITLLKQEQKSIEIIIRDNGMGMSKDQCGRVFDIFYSTTHSSGGTGLGLYITQQLVIKYNGRIMIESQEGTGTSIHIFFPIPEGEN